MAKSVDELSAELRAAMRLEFAAAPPDAEFSQNYVAVVDGRSPRWFELARHTGNGPPYVRKGGRFTKNKSGLVQLYGGRAMYRKADVLAWMKRQPRFENTSQYAPEAVAA